MLVMVAVELSFDQTYIFALVYNCCLSVAKAHASGPPGFAMASRIPPGFSCGRVERGCNSSGITFFIV